MTDRNDVGRQTRRGPPWRWFIAWLVLGAGYSLGLLGALTIGVFVLPVAIAGTVLVARRPQARVGTPGLLSGLGFPLLYVAYLNRGGPGTVCTVQHGGQTCTDEWAPWPWIGVAAVLMLAGAAAFVFRRRASGAH